MPLRDAFRSSSNIYWQYGRFLRKNPNKSVACRLHKLLQCYFRCLSEILCICVQGGWDSTISSFGWLFYSTPAFRFAYSLYYKTLLLEKIWWPVALFSLQFTAVRNYICSFDFAKTFARLVLYIFESLPRSGHNLRLLKVRQGCPLQIYSPTLTFSSSSFSSY